MSDPQRPRLGRPAEAEARARMSTFQHSELLPEHEILQNRIPTATEGANQGSDPEEKQAELARWVWSAWKQ